MVRNCLICEKAFKTKPSHIAKGWGKYCSQQCHGKANIGKSKTKLSNVTEKKCTHCKITKEVGEFSLDGKYVNGSSRYKSWCKGCHKLFDKKHYSTTGGKFQKAHVAKWCKEKFDLINEIKNNEKCCVCKEPDSVCFDFHHIDPSTKKFSISRGRTRSSITFPSFKEELIKCVILCANCHRKFHAGKITLPSNAMNIVTN
jgi:hypothetical protein